MPCRRLVKSIAFTLLLLTTPASSVQAAEGLGGKLEAVINGPEYKQARWGILVVDAKTGEKLYSHNGEQLFAPASTTKLYSCAAALGTLGADFRFETFVFRRGDVKEGRLK